jgi:hypothetical protein
MARQKVRTLLLTREQADDDVRLLQRMFLMLGINMVTTAAVVAGLIWMNWWPDFLR